MTARTPRALIEVDQKVSKCTPKTTRHSLQLKSYRPSVSTQTQEEEPHASSWPLRFSTIGSCGRRFWHSSIDHPCSLVWRCCNFFLESFSGPKVADDNSIQRSLLATGAWGTFPLILYAMHPICLGCGARKLTVLVVMLIGILRCVLKVICWIQLLSPTTITQVPRMQHMNACWRNRSTDSKVFNACFD